MGFLLIDQPNPNGNHFYPSRRERVLAIVVHITAGLEDLDAQDDHSAENVANYAATTDRDVSWHTGSDTDSWVDLLPSSAVAWHASNYNGCTVGHEISKRTTDWRSMPASWVRPTLRMAALGPDGQSGLRRKAIELGVPFRWATKAELDHARATGGPPVGFITHAELQWEDRRDPGYVTEGGRVIDTFPRAEFMDLLNDRRRTIGGEDMLIKKLTGPGTGQFGLLSGGILSGVDNSQGWAEQTGEKTGVLGVTDAVWNDMVRKSNALESQARLLGEMSAKLDKLIELNTKPSA